MLCVDRGRTLRTFQKGTESSSHKLPHKMRIIVNQSDKALRGTEDSNLNASILPISANDFFLYSDVALRIQTQLKCTLKLNHKVFIVGSLSVIMSSMTVMNSTECHKETLYFNQSDWVPITSQSTLYSFFNSHSISSSIFDCPLISSVSNPSDE